MWTIIKADLRENKTPNLILACLYLVFLALFIYIDGTGSRGVRIRHLLAAMLIPVLIIDSLQMLKVFNEKRYRLHVGLPAGALTIALCRPVPVFFIWWVLTVVTGIIFMLPATPSLTAAHARIWLFYHAMALCFISARLIIFDLMTRLRSPGNPIQRVLNEGLAVSLHLILILIWILGLGIPGNMIFNLFEDQRRILADSLLNPAGLGWLHGAGIGLLVLSLLSFQRREKYL